MKVVFSFLALVTTVLCEEAVVDLVATKERQNLTAPSLEGIERPHEFKWRIRLNTRNPSKELSLTLHSFTLPETVTCSRSYLDVLGGNYSFGKKCGEWSEETTYLAYDSLDVIFHVGSEDGPHDFLMSYSELETVTCYTESSLPLVIIILTSVALVLVIIVSCCVGMYYRRRERKRKPANNASTGPKTDMDPATVIDGPPSYDAVIKGDNPPPPYSSVVTSQA